MVGWKWTEGMPVLLEKLELDVSLALENGNDTAKSKINHMWPNNVNVELGFRMAPSGTQKPEIEPHKHVNESFSPQGDYSHSTNATGGW